MDLTIHLPDEFEPALKAQASAHGVSADGYVQKLVERDLATLVDHRTPGPPFKTGRGTLAKYGPAPTAEEIDANRAEMFQNFGENF
jgi:hypothetical protein